MSYSSDSDRQITLQVCGGNYGQNQRRSNYTLTVPYSRLSQTIQRIQRSGGRITGIVVQKGAVGGKVQGTVTPTKTVSVESATPLQQILEPIARGAAVPGALPASPAAIPAIPPLSRGRRKRRRHSQLPGTIRRKNRQKTRTKAKIYLLG